MKKLSWLFAIGIIGIIVTLKIKGCNSERVSFNKALIYENEDSNGEKNTVYLIPENYIVLQKSYNGKMDFGIYKFFGREMENLFGFLYSSQKSLLGIKLVVGYDKNWEGILKLIDKNSFENYSTFKEVGSSYITDVSINKNDLRIGSEYFKYRDTDFMDTLFFKIIDLDRFKENK